MKETGIEKKPCQHASCRLRDEEEVKEEKERRKEERWVEVERSGSSDHTNCIQEPVSAESISSHSAMFSLAHYVLCSSAFLPLFFSILSYDPTGVTIGEVLPAVCFPSVCEHSLLQHPGSYEPTVEHLRTRPSWRTERVFPHNQTNH